MAEAAVQSADQRQDYTSPVYVVNLTANAVVKYGFERVWVEPDRELGLAGYRYTVARPQIAEFEVAAYTDFVYQNSKGSVLVDPGFSGQGLPGNVYQDMTNPSAHAALQSYLNGNALDLGQRLLVFLQGLNPFTAFDPGALSITLVVRYSDGSRAQYRYDPASKQWERVKGSERDSHGNHVVTTPADFTSEGGGERVFDFEGGNDEDLIRFLQMAEMYGIRVGGTAARRIIICVTVGGVTTCSTAIL